MTEFKLIFIFWLWRHLYMNTHIKHFYPIPIDIRVLLTVRFDRPFERTIVLQKDSTGHVGFVYKKGKITAIAKETSAAR